MGEKQPKFGFSLKLSSETSEKLKSEAAVVSDAKPQPPQPEVDSPVVSIEAPESKPQTEDVSPRIAEAEEEKKMEVEEDKPEGAGADDAFAQHVHYEGSEAIYTDPASGQQYLWNNESNEWKVRSTPAVVAPNADGAQDGRTYSFENNIHTYTEPDGSVYFWDQDKSAWFPKVDDEFMAHYQMAYGFVDNTSTPSQPQQETPKAEQPQPKKGPSEPSWFDLPEDQNNKVYVSNLPTDITEEEFVDVMQKCGLIMQDPSTKKLKIKMYTKPNSTQPKGDALCTYIKVESVELALNILDGSNVRDHRIKVQRAKFQMKGNFNPALKPKKKSKKNREKAKKMQDRLFDWRPEKMRGEKSKHERVVIIKNLFEPSLFDKEVDLILEYQQDMREECSKCGEVKKVLLYDRHPEGVCQVTMKEPEEAENVVKLIDGRWFGKRQLSAAIWDGKTKYKMEETDADMNKRIDGWNKFLDEDEGKKEEKKEP